MTRIGTIAVSRAMYQHKNNVVKSYKTINDAEAFLSRVRQGDRLYGSC